MKARGLLMIEHRLIEKMLALVNKTIASFDENTYDCVLIENMVDFIRVYADRTHHGKEEDILFRQLENKQLDEANKSMMAELVNDHLLARTKVKELVESNERFKGGDQGAIVEVKKIVEWLSRFYPEHIKREDQVFFPNTEKYFTDGELEQLLNQYYAFDAGMIHEKYGKLYEDLKKG